MMNYMMQMRQFASDLPHHTKLEMPNLSPTMEKVRFNSIHLQLMNATRSIRYFYSSILINFYYYQDHIFSI